MRRHQRCILTAAWNSVLSLLKELMTVEEVLACLVRIAWLLLLISDNSDLS